MVSIVVLLTDITCCVFAVSMAAACTSFANLAAGRPAEITAASAAEIITVDQAFNVSTYFTASEEVLASCVTSELGVNYSWTVDLGDSFTINHTLMLSLDGDIQSGMLSFSW